jgi:hypothetical protein
MRRLVQPASASSAGGHPQPAAVSQPFSGVRSSSVSPVAARPAAGTNAHRWGWLVIRIDSVASIAQPTAKPSSADPVMTGSAEPANTSRARTAAVVDPVSRDPAMMRRMGPAAAGSVVVISPPGPC